MVTRIAGIPLEHVAARSGPHSDSGGGKRSDQAKCQDSGRTRPAHVLGARLCSFGGVRSSEKDGRGHWTSRRFAKVVSSLRWYTMFV